MSQGKSKLLTTEDPVVYSLSKVPENPFSDFLDDLKKSHAISIKLDRYQAKISKILIDNKILLKNEALIKLEMCPFPLGINLEIRYAKKEGNSYHWYGSPTYRIYASLERPINMNFINEKSLTDCLTHTFVINQIQHERKKARQTLAEWKKLKELANRHLMSR